MKIVNVGNGKGGVGKSTLVAQLGFYLAEEGHRVLMIDMDGQEDLSRMFGVDVQNAPITSDALFNETFDYDMSHLHKVTGWHHRKCTDGKDSNIWVLGALYARLADINTQGKEASHASMKYFPQNIKQFSKDFDYVLLDLPPSLGVTQLCALLGATHAVIPVIADLDFCGEEKMAQYMKLFMNCRKRNEALSKSKPIVVLNMIDAKSNAVKGYLAWAKRYFGGALIDRWIERSEAAVANAKLEKRAVWYKTRSGNDRAKGAQYRRRMEDIAGRLV